MCTCHQFCLVPKGPITWCFYKKILRITPFTSLPLDMEKSKGEWLPLLVSSFFQVRAVELLGVYNSLWQHLYILHSWTLSPARVGCAIPAVFACKNEKWCTCDFATLSYATLATDYLAAGSSVHSLTPNQLLTCWSLLESSHPVPICQSCHQVPSNCATCAPSHKQHKQRYKQDRSNKTEGSPTSLSLPL